MNVSSSVALVVNRIAVQNLTLMKQHRQALFATEEPSQDDGEDALDDDDIPESIIKVDDGGSNLTDRFKYKVSH